MHSLLAQDTTRPPERESKEFSSESKEFSKQPYRVQPGLIGLL